MDDVTFARRAARRTADNDGPLLQWATGLPTKERSIYAGWFVEANKSPELDEAMVAAGFATGVLKHGSGSFVEHWLLPEIDVFVLAEDVPSIKAMARPDRYGVAFGWTTTDTNRQVSRLQVQVLIRDLLLVGWTQPLIATMKGTVTSDMIAALRRQYDVLDAATAAAKAKGKPDPQLPFYAFSIPLTAGPEVKRGKPGNQKEIAPIVASIPDPIDATYLAAQYIGKNLVQVVESQIDAAVEWSRTTSQAWQAEAPQQMQDAA